MEEFKKWFNQFNNSLTSKTEKKMQERAWIAALEWVLDNVEEDDAGRCMISVTEIEKELK